MVSCFSEKYFENFNLDKKKMSKIKKRKNFLEKTRHFAFLFFSTFVMKHANKIKRCKNTKNIFFQKSMSFTLAYFLLPFIYMQKYALKFYCEKCEYECSRKFLWEQHISTRKHKMITNDNKMITKNMLFCICGKYYKYSSGLSRHQKQCKIIIEKPKISDDIENGTTIVNNVVIQEKKESLSDRDSDIKHILKEILKENRELKQQMKNIKGDNLTTNNTTNNNNISINVFLNEHCKNAINFSDFMSNIQVSIQNVLQTSKMGYIEGIAAILMENLKKLETTMRPIHCSDKKRMLFYIKDENTWTKEDGEKVEKAITKISNKQIQEINVIDQSNEDYPDHLSNILGASDEETQKKHKREIVKKIGEELFIKDILQKV